MYARSVILGVAHVFRINGEVFLSVCSDALAGLVVGR